jgi:hypothetical protein
VAITCEHVCSAPSATCLQLIEGVALWHSLAAPAHWPLTMFEDLRASITSPRVASPSDQELGPLEDLGAEASPPDAYSGRGFTSFTRMPSMHGNASTTATPA